MERSDRKVRSTAEDKENTADESPVGRRAERNAERTASLARQAKQEAQADEERLIRLGRDLDRDEEYKLVAELHRSQSQMLFHDLREILRDPSMGGQHRLGAAQQMRLVLEEMRDMAQGSSDSSFSGWDDDDD